MIISGRGFGQYRRVIGNTEDTLTLEKPWNVEPDCDHGIPGFGAVHRERVLRQPEQYAVPDVLLARQRGQRGGNASGRPRQGGRHGRARIEASSTRTALPGTSPGSIPIYYNMFSSGWMDGTALWLTNSGSKADNAHRGYSNFGNFMVGNRIRQPHTTRTGFHHQVPRDTAGISVSGGSGRAGTSHTIVADNFFGSTYTGIRVNPMARKTMVLRNEFDHVDEPIDDRGIRTVVKDNRLTGNHGSRGDPIPDVRSERDLPAWQPRPWKPAPSETVPPLVPRRCRLEVPRLGTAVHGLLGRRQRRAAVAVPAEPAAVVRDAERVRFQERASAQGGVLPALARAAPTALPRSSVPRRPSCWSVPTCSPELQQLGLNYAWNEKVSGRRLADLKPDTWLLMDCVGAHDWMVTNHYCGHLGKVNVLLPMEP